MLLTLFPSFRSRVRDDEPGGQLGEAEPKGDGGGGGGFQLALAHAAVRHRGAIEWGQVRPSIIGLTFSSNSGDFLTKISQRLRDPSIHATLDYLSDIPVNI